MNELLRYSPEVVDAFPALRAGIVHVTGLRNGPSSADLVAAFEAEQLEVVGRLAATPIAELDAVTAWRRAFTSLGVKPTKYRVAAEALLRRLDKSGAIPSINMMVDIGNLVSIRYGVPVAVFDQATVAGATTVRFATGDESFTDLGSPEATHPAPGEVIFADDADVVSARRWCWRQSAQSATGPDSNEVVITVEALHDAASGDVDAALDDLVALLSVHQPNATVDAARLI